ncbi:MAG: 5'/3'-nucleotidase SurE, partial [Cyanobacteria bacterium J06643_4]
MSLIVLTNDDGFGAPGILALKESVASMGTVVSVAPDSHLSGCSHQLNRGGAIGIDQRAEGDYAIGGTPADCSRVAISHLYAEADWVLSGINAGGNLGSDTYVSGTVAAVREATLLRKNAIALSQYRYRNQPFDWPRATRLASKVLRQLMAEPLSDGQFWNVNFPAPPLDGSADDPEIVVCQRCTQPLPTEFAIAKACF